MPPAHGGTLLRLPTSSQRAHSAWYWNATQIQSTKTSCPFVRPSLTLTGSSIDPNMGFSLRGRFAPQNKAGNIRNRKRMVAFSPSISARNCIIASAAVQAVLVHKRSRVQPRICLKSLQGPIRFPKTPCNPAGCHVKNERWAMHPNT